MVDCGYCVHPYRILPPGDRTDAQWSGAARLLDDSFASIQVSPPMSYIGGFPVESFYNHCVLHFDLAILDQT